MSNLNVSNQAVDPLTEKMSNLNVSNQAVEPLTEKMSNLNVSNQAVDPTLPSFREMMADPEWNHGEYFDTLFDKDEKGNIPNTEKNIFLKAKLTKLIEEQKNYKGPITNNNITAAGAIIAIDGAHGCGKTTFTKLARRIIKEIYKKTVINLSFCTGVKSFLDAGRMMPEVYGTNSEKNQPVKKVFDANITARQVMRMFGQSIQTSAMQMEGCEYVWCRYMFQRICDNRDKIIIIDDAYLPHWRQILRGVAKKNNMPIFNVLIKRNGNKKDGTHVTQMANNDTDNINLHNNGTREDFAANVKDIIEDIMVFKQPSL